MIGGGMSDLRASTYQATDASVSKDAQGMAVLNSLDTAWAFAV